MSTTLAFVAPAHKAKTSMRLKAASTSSLPQHRSQPKRKQKKTRPDRSGHFLRWLWMRLERKVRNRKSRSLRRNQGPTGIPRALGEKLRKALDSSAGETLPATLANIFSRKFGSDLSGVTIHRDSIASEAVCGIGANAFARGNKIYFRAGAYQPDSVSGQALSGSRTGACRSTKAGPSGGAPATASSHGSHAETFAQKAARDQVAGRGSLSAGPSAPVSIAADNGVSYEDEDAKVSVLATDDDAADRVADLQAEADKARAAAGVTDADVAAKDEEAQKLREAVQSSVAKKQAAKPKGKRTKTKRRKPNRNSLPDSTQVPI